MYYFVPIYSKWMNMTKTRVLKKTIFKPDMGKKKQINITSKDVNLSKAIFLFYFKCDFVTICENNGIASFIFYKAGCVLGLSMMTLEYSFMNKAIESTFDTKEI